MFKYVLFFKRFMNFDNRDLAERIKAAQLILEKKASSVLFLDALRTFPITPADIRICLGAHGIPLPHDDTGISAYIENCAQRRVRPCSRDFLSFLNEQGLFVQPTGVSNYHQEYGGHKLNSAVLAGALEGGKTHVIELSARFSPATSREQYELFLRDGVNRLVNADYQPFSGNVDVDLGLPQLIFRRIPGFENEFRTHAGNILYFPMSVVNWYLNLAERYGVN